MGTPWGGIGFDGGFSKKKHRMGGAPPCTTPKTCTVQSFVTETWLPVLCPVGWTCWALVGNTRKTYFEKFSKPITSNNRIFFFFACAALYFSSKHRTLTVCSYHVMYTFQSESTLCSCLNVKELPAWNRCDVWNLSDCNGIQLFSL